VSEHEWTGAATWIGPLLHGWANQIAARFNQPVYLVGSALVEEKPRDTDVVVILTDEEFLARYGMSGLATQKIGDHADDRDRRYWQDVAKLSAWCNRHHGNGSLNVDFKVQDESQVKARHYSPDFRLRLDSLEVPQQTSEKELRELEAKTKELINHWQQEESARERSGGLR
jgi:hypothetical protein